MDTIAPKTPVPSAFAEWRNLEPADAAQRVVTAVQALPAPLRRAAISWMPAENEIAGEFARARAERSGGALAGVPYFLKDLFDAAGSPTAAGSTFLSSVRVPSGDAAIVRLLRSQGAVLAGKTQLVEFASGLTGENPHFGDCPHPRFPDRLTGGSSSGSAAMVAAGVVPLAIGTDTGGSVRVPAAFCGLFGFRLTPRDPLIADAFPLSPTMDTAGWFTATSENMLASWRAIVGAPPTIPSGSALRGCYLSGPDLGATMTAGIEEACASHAFALGARVDSRVSRAIAESWSGAVDAYVTIGMTEANRVHRNWLEPFRANYDPLIWKRFRDAGEIAPEAIAHAHSKRAQAADYWQRILQDFDYVALPSAPCPAPHKSDCTPELRRNILALTAPASLGGLPCLCLPVPLPGGLTAGLQVVTRDPASPVFARLLTAI
ncbi:MAG TPA: amidase [Candidatus Didemnitutus sp.]|nr:amidase [Candidatus Didemnitutus sp.]